jgi:hypothetical protein
MGSSTDSIVATAKPVSRFLRVSSTVGFTALLIGACSELPSAVPDSAPVANPMTGRMKVEMVAYSSAQTVSAVTVSRSGRLFVSLMLPNAKVSTSIGEIIHGVIRPYPIAAWNTLRNDGDLTGELTSVRAIDIDHHNHLWVLNCPTDASGGGRAETAALVEIQLNDNKTRRVISLDSMADVCSASVNQLRFRSDDLVAFLSAASRSEPAFSLDLQTQECLRTPAVVAPGLDHPCARAQEPHQVSLSVNPAADALAPHMHCPNGELWMDSDGRLYTPVRASSEPERDRIGSSLRLVVDKDRMPWPAGFARGPDGAFYMSAVQVCRYAMAQGDVSPSAVLRISSDMLGIVASAH